MDNTTETNLKLALAEEFPELISVATYTDGGVGFYWKGAAYVGLVTPREWDWAVKECIKKLNLSEQRRFTNLLHVRTKLPCSDGDYLLQDFVCISAPWQDQAAVYFEVKGVKI